MPDFSHAALQSALYNQLHQDVNLVGLVAGIYDRPPEGTAFPYITIGDLTGNDWSSKTTSGMEYQAGVHIWSREGGRRQAAVIMERVYALLHQADFPVAGQALVMIRFTGSQIALENDGWTYRGTMAFRILLQDHRKECI